MSRRDYLQLQTIIWVVSIRYILFFFLYKEIVNVHGASKAYTTSIIWSAYQGLYLHKYTAAILLLFKHV